VATEKWEGIREKNGRPGGVVSKKPRTRVRKKKVAQNEGESTQKSESPKSGRV